MKTMVERTEVLHRYRVQQQSKRQIAREMHISRHTVDKIVLEYEEQCVAPGGGCNMSALEILTGTKPKYKTPERPCRVMTEEMLTFIKKCLEENTVRKATGRHKLLWKCKNIHAQLCEQGFDISYPCVCKHVRRLQSAATTSSSCQEVYIRREHPAGMECEFDWGEIPLVIAGKKLKVQLAVFTLLHSNRRSAWLFLHQDTLAFMESHRNFFLEINGVPETMVYDNMKVAVTVRGGGRGRPSTKFPTVAMQRMSLYYSFSTRFCNIRSGWEKGSVERSVEVVRNEAFVSRLNFESLDEAQKWLEKSVERLNARSGIVGISTEEKRRRIQADLAALSPAPHPMGCFEAEDHTPGKYCTVMVCGNNYSVPETLAGKSVLVKLYSHKLIMFHEGKRVAEHQRSYDKGEWIMKLEHYLSTFLRKPGALNTSTALNQVPKEIQELYRVHFSKGNQRDFIEFMMYARDHGILHNEIIVSAKRLKDKGIQNITAEHLKVDIQGIRARKEDAKQTNAPSVAEHTKLLIENYADLTLTELSTIMNAKKQLTTSLPN